MKNIFTYLGIVLVVAASVIGSFTGVEVSRWVEFSGYAVGLALCTVSIVDRAKSKDWKLYIALSGVAIGTILLVFAGISESTITSIMAAVFGLVALIAGLLPVLLSDKNK